MKGYFVRFSSGTDMFVVYELQTLNIVDCTILGNRTLVLKPRIHPQSLLRLKSADDVFILLQHFKIGHTKTALADFKYQIQQLALKKAVKQIRQIRGLTPITSFSITTSFKQKTNYRQQEIHQIFQETIEQKYKWQFVENEVYQSNYLSFRIILEDGQILIGLRLGLHPLHRRTYKKFHQKGSLKPTIAYCMARLADIEPNEVVYDPMCGVGTTLIEAGLHFKPKRLIGTDINPLAIELAQQNAQLAGLHLNLYHQDALQFLTAQVDVMLCNLPWGKQILKEEQLPLLYQQLFKKWSRLLVKTGRIVVLTDKTELLENVVEQQGSFMIELSFSISLFGRHPKMYLLTVK